MQRYHRRAPASRLGGRIGKPGHKLCPLKYHAHHGPLKANSPAMDDANFCQSQPIAFM